MADIAFLNVDLDVVSQTPLDPLVESLSPEAVVLYQGWEGGLHLASFETAADTDSAEATILRFCELLENLPKEALAVWRECRTRTFDIGFESGDSPSALRSVLHPPTLNRLADLGASVVVTIYARAG